MKAITVTPLQANSIGVEEIDEPSPDQGSVLVDTLAVGVCGTDLEIVSGAYGWAPPGHQRLVLGHESLGRVREAPEGASVRAGDLVVGIVRRPDPVPCPACAALQWDFCRNGLYTEHGIKELDGFMREQYRAEPDALVVVDQSLGQLGVLLEPTSVVAKAWEQVDKIGNRAPWEPHVAVVTGAGPIGLLAALIGVQRGYEVHVFDQVSEGLKPDLVQALGAHYHTGHIGDAVPQTDIVIECTGVASLIFDAMGHIAPGGVVCLTGVSSGGHSIEVDAGLLNRSMVLQNEAVVGSVNANRTHYEIGAKVLADADHAWLARLITRQIPLDNFADALNRQPDDVKVVITIGG